jgi:hypothetical protein
MYAPLAKNYSTSITKLRLCQKGYANILSSPEIRTHRCCNLLPAVTYMMYAPLAKNYSASPTKLRLCQKDASKKIVSSPEIRMLSCPIFLIQLRTKVRSFNPKKPASQP